MRRLTKTERAAAAAVLAAAATVAVTGYRLLKKHTLYLVHKAAAVFHDDEILDGSFSEGENEDHPDEI